MGFLALKFDQGGRFSRRSNLRISGVPDIIALNDKGRFIAIEVKTAEGRIRPEQKELINKINELNGVAFVCRSLSDLRKELIERGLM
jgi:Holliday junction resolvase